MLNQGQTMLSAGSRTRRLTKVSLCLAFFSAFVLKVIASTNGRSSHQDKAPAAGRSKRGSFPHPYELRLLSYAL